MEGYKIDLSPYEYMDSYEVVDGKNVALVDQKVIMVDPKNRLPAALTNAAIGPDENYDVYTMGKIAEQIRKSNGEIILSVEDYNNLLKRTKVIAKMAHGILFETVRRIMEPERVKLKEDKT